METLPASDSPGNNSTAPQSEGPSEKQAVAEVNRDDAAEVAVMAKVEAPNERDQIQETVVVSDGLLEGSPKAADDKSLESEPRTAVETDAAKPTELAELASWEQRVREQRTDVAKRVNLRTETRIAVEQLQRHHAELQTRQGKAAEGGAAADMIAERQSILARLEQHVEDLRRVLDPEGEPHQRLAGAQAALGVVAVHKAEVEAQLSEVATAAAQAAQRAEDATAAAAAAASRLRGMVPASDVQAREAESSECRESLQTLEKELRHLRTALAEALSSAADLPNALRELGVLRESTEAAADRTSALEEVNRQLQARIEQLERQVRGLRKGTVDLQSEEDLMREVIVQQSESLVRRVEDLTDERTTANADREQLLGITTNLMGRVDAAEARLDRCPELQSQNVKLKSNAEALEGEVERLRRSNQALCQQVLGEEGEGPLAGAAAQAVSLGGDHTGKVLSEDFDGLVRGHVPTDTRGDACADAAALALRLQRLLAEREEAFWLERQRLSERILALERVRPSRASGALRHYDAAVRGQPTAFDPAGAAAAVSGGLRRLREAVGG